MKKLLLSFILVFGFSLCEGQSWVWGRGGTTGFDPFINCVSADTKGNGYLLINFKDSITLGSNHLTTPSYDDCLVKYDSNGNMLWLQQPIGYTGDQCTINTDDSDNVFISGPLFDTMQFGTIRLIGGGGLPNFIVKYASNGHVLWGNKIGGNAWVEAVASDDSANIVVTGYFVDSLSFGKSKFYNAHDYELFIAKYSSTGIFRWANVSTGNSLNYTVAYSTCCDKYGNIYVTGNFRDSVSIKSMTLKGRNFDIFLLKFDLGGNILFAKQSYSQPVGGSIFVSSIVTDNQNNFYITGTVSDTVIIGGVQINQTKTPTVYLAKFDPNSNLIWLKVSNTSGVSGNRISTNSCNNIFFAGSNQYGGNMKFIFANDSLNISTADGVFLEFDTSGRIISSATIGGVGDDYDCIASNPKSECVFASGDFSAPTIIGKDTLLSSWGEPPFIARWAVSQCNSLENIPFPHSSENVTILFPNPNTGAFTLEVESEKYKVESVEVYNIMGQKVFSSNYSLSTNHYSLDLSSQPSGIYLYRVIDETGKLLGEGKFVIEK